MTDDTSSTSMAPAIRRRCAPRVSTGSVYRPRDPKTGKPLRVWWLNYVALGGRRVRESSGSTAKGEALAKLRQRLGEVGIGRFIGPEAQRVTFEDLMDGVERSYQLAGLRSLDRVRQARLQLARTFAGLRALEITAPVLEAYAVRRGAEGFAAASIKYELAILRRGFTIAVKQGCLVSRPAFPTIRVENARTGFFEADEFERVVGELPEPLKGLARFGFYTGWRAREVRGLTWADVDWRAGIVRLEAAHSKNGRARLFPFAALPPLRGVLEAQRAYTEAVQRRLGCVVPFVFHREGHAIRNCHTAWRSACRRAKVPGRLFHDLRRTSVRNLVRAGVPERVAMALSGHLTRTVFDRYHIVAERDLGEAVEKLAMLHAQTAPLAVLPFPAASAVASVATRARGGDR